MIVTHKHTISRPGRWFSSCRTRADNLTLNGCVRESHEASGPEKPLDDWMLKQSINAPTADVCSPKADRTVCTFCTRLFSIKPLCFFLISRNANLRLSHLILFVLDGVWHGLVVFYCVYLFLAGGGQFAEAVYFDSSSHGNHFDIGLCGGSSMVYIIVSLNLRVLFMSRDINWPVAGGYIFTLVLNLLLIMAIQCFAPYLAYSHIAVIISASNTMHQRIIAVEPFEFTRRGQPLEASEFSQISLMKIRFVGGFAHQCIIYTSEICTPCTALSSSFNVTCDLQNRKRYHPEFIPGSPQKISTYLVSRCPVFRIQIKANLSGYAVWALNMRFVFYQILTQPFRYLLDITWSVLTKKLKNGTDKDRLAKVEALIQLLNDDVSSYGNGAFASQLPSSMNRAMCRNKEYSISLGQRSDESSVFAITFNFSVGCLEEASKNTNRCELPFNRDSIPQMKSLCAEKWRNTCLHIKGYQFRKAHTHTNEQYNSTTVAEIDIIYEGCRDILKFISPSSVMDAKHASVYSKTKNDSCQSDTYWLFKIVQFHGSTALQSYRRKPPAT
ncbi:ATPase class VI type 11c [Clonorchis sinensis]|uniref:ATPase class VI type 11c n=1 Tax=Clonorchis sinensis TaxID=79923 RepID=G7Y887_CLOSI|nr:ATPase class VI type 11c [Clonorchis sinensis]